MVFNMPQDTRKNFSLEVIQKTLEKQGNCCGKCGLPMTYGYEAHHIDGNNANDAEDNCQLLHVRCHKSELWATLKEQKEKTINNIENTIAQALSDKGMAGAALKEIAGLIDKEILLQNQLYGIEHFNLPATEKTEFIEAVANAERESFQNGYIEGLRQFPTILEKTKNAE